MFRLKLSMQHNFNPLHVYCRLTPILGRDRGHGLCPEVRDPLRLAPYLMKRSGR